MSSKKFHTMPKKGSSSVSAPDLLQMNPDSKNGYLRERCFTKFIKNVKWRHRYVVLAHSALHVFDNEMSRTEDSAIPLYNYKAVKRETFATCAWGFTLVPRASSVQSKSFACASDSDRKLWMIAINDRMYGLHDLKRTSMSFSDDGIDEEEKEYLELERELPISNYRTKSESRNSECISDNDEDDRLASATKSLTAELRHSFTRKMSLDTPSNSSYDVCTPVRKSDPPRYSAVVDGEECHYQNLPSNPKASSVGLEKACTITDQAVCRDRQKCNEMLINTDRKGAYLIRQSRTGNYGVLAVYLGNQTVKEFPIEKAYGMFHLRSDPNTELPSVEALLSYYSTQQHLPFLEIFLDWGIHELVDSPGGYVEPDNLIDSSW